MSVCNVIRDLMPLYADSAISADSRRAIREHLRTCPECRGYFKELHRVHKRRDSTPPPPPMPPELAYPALARRMRAHRNRIALIGGSVLTASLLVSAMSLAILMKAAPDSTNTQEKTR